MREHFPPTFGLFWREWQIGVACWLLRRWFKFHAHVENEIHCTVALVLAEDRETYQRQFTVTPRFHEVDEQETVN